MFTPVFHRTINAYSTILTVEPIRDLESRDILRVKIAILVYKAMCSIFETCNRYFYLIRCFVQNLGRFNHSGAEIFAYLCGPDRFSAASQSPNSAAATALVCARGLADTNASRLLLRFFFLFY